MDRDFYLKSEIIDYVWQYSKYHGNLLTYCEQMVDEDSGNGFAALLFLFNLTENIFKDTTKDYDSSLFDVIKKLKDQRLITSTEYFFLNGKENSIRKLRNLLAHANLSKYNLSFIEEGEEILYPLTENETCIKIYNMYSEILFNIMLRLVSKNFKEPLYINIDDEINKNKINIKELTPENLLKFKGLNVSDFSNWDQLSETDKYRLVENSSDVTILTEIFSALLKN